MRPRLPGSSVGVLISDQALCLALDRLPSVELSVLSNRLGPRPLDLS
jgi:hypothetical protein